MAKGRGPVNPFRPFRPFRPRSAVAAALLGLVAGCGRPAQPDGAVDPTSTAAASTAPAASTVPSAPSAARVHGGAADDIDPARLRSHVAWLAAPAQRGRGSCSADEARAAEHLVAELERMGLGPWRPVTGEPVRVQRLTATARGKECQSQNVLALVPAAGARDERVIVLGAHYDHLGAVGTTVYPGAEDNASGVAVVLEIARVLASRPARGHAVLVALFGAEELGMQGSSAFVASGLCAPSRIVAMVNVDMIGRPLVDSAALALPRMAAGIDAERGVGVVGTAGRPGLRRLVDAACAEAGVKAHAPEDFPALIAAAIDRVTRARGDNWPFEQAGVPTVFFSSAESDDYHQPTDVPERLDVALMARRARAVLALVERLAQVERAELLDE